LEAKRLIPKSQTTVLQTRRFRTNKDGAANGIGSLRSGFASLLRSARYGRRPPQTRFASSNPSISAPCFHSKFVILKSEFQKMGPLAGPSSNPFTQNGHPKHTLLELFQAISFERIRPADAGRFDPITRLSGLIESFPDFT
jgi:hypothetical protein